MASIDLGFLLITFFIFTTSMSSPTTMKLIVPKNVNDNMPVKASGALSIVIGQGENIYYYNGQLEKGGTNRDLFRIIISANGNIHEA